MVLFGSMNYLSTRVNEINHSNICCKNIFKRKAEFLLEVYFMIGGSTPFKSQNFPYY